MPAAEAPGELPGEDAGTLTGVVASDGAFGWGLPLAVFTFTIAAAGETGGGVAAVAVAANGVIPPCGEETAPPTRARAGPASCGEAVAIEELDILGLGVNGVAAEDEGVRPETGVSLLFT